MSFRVIACVQLVLILAHVSAAEALRVSVSVLPLKALVEEIGGDRVEVQSLQQEGDNCSVFEPRPSSISFLARAEVFFRTGVGYESSLLEKIKRQYRNLEVLDMRDALDSAVIEPSGHHHHHDGEPCSVHTDPHIWTSPPNLELMSIWVAQCLVELRPENEDYFLQRAEAFAQRLHELNESIEKRLEPFRGRAFFIYHPALSYFASAYGLEQVAIEESGRVPSAFALQRVVTEARSKGIRVVFVQPQESQRQAALVADAIGGKLVEVDPMSTDLEGNLLRISRALEDSFRDAEK